MTNKEFKDVKYRDPVFVSMMVKHNEDMHRAHVREMVDKFTNRDHIHKCEASCSVYGKVELECPVCGNPIKTDKKAKELYELTIYYPSGTKRHKQHYYKAGEPHGMETWWYENGSKWSAVNYEHGSRHGLYTSWYENGQKKVNANYKDGELHGLLTWWYENGQKECERHYKNGELHGLLTWWYENGKKDNEQNYIGGVEVKK